MQVLNYHNGIIVVICNALVRDDSCTPYDCLKHRYTQLGRGRLNFTSFTNLPSAASKRMPQLLPEQCTSHRRTKGSYIRRD